MECSSIETMEEPSAERKGVYSISSVYLLLNQFKMEITTKAISPREMMDGDINEIINLINHSITLAGKNQQMYEIPLNNISLTIKQREQIIIEFLNAGWEKAYFTYSVNGKFDKFIVKV